MSADQVRQFTVAADDDGIRLDRWFRRNLPEASFGQVSRWARRTRSTRSKSTSTAVSTCGDVCLDITMCSAVRRRSKWECKSVVA